MEPLCLTASILQTTEPICMTFTVPRYATAARVYAIYSPVSVCLSIYPSPSQLSTGEEEILFALSNGNHADHLG